MVNLREVGKSGSRRFPAKTTTNVSQFQPVKNIFSSSFVNRKVSHLFHLIKKRFFSSSTMENVFES